MKVRISLEPNEILSIIKEGERNFILHFSNIDIFCSASFAQLISPKIRLILKSDCMMSEFTFNKTKSSLKMLDKIALSILGEKIRFDDDDFTLSETEVFVLCRELGCLNELNLMYPSNINFHEILLKFRRRSLNKEKDPSYYYLYFWIFSRFKQTDFTALSGKELKDYENFVKS